ncbi:permease-like cell division protein FtsX [Halomonas halocynthiae]|uniref:permease-like cell division protein FtsX n=1 Tax=Halomonas halocynthiae TaxID=176290 RepID=UPI00042201B2|nr:permease-like cell division protein FtsX [Halomonas halocynthiae]
MSREASQERGARKQRTTNSSRWRGWVRHHRAMSLDSALRLVRTPLGSLFTMLAIAIALVLPAGLWLMLDGARLLDAELDASATATVYLASEVDDEEARRIQQALEAHAQVNASRLITASQGMEEFQRSLGLEDLLSQLPENPLPATIVLTPVDPEPSAMRQLADQLSTVTGVDEVRLDLAWLDRLRKLAELGRRATLGLGVLFGLGVLLVVGNTIRLAVASRRQEIEVVTLIGATHAFVRRPFLYSGAWYGFGGGLLALALLVLGGDWLATPISDLAASYGANYALPKLGWIGSATLLSCSTILGWLGAWLAVSQHLASIYPR